MMVFYWNKKEKGIKISHLRESCVQKGISVGRSGYSTLVLFEDWDYIDEVDCMTEGLLAKVWLDWAQHLF